MESRAGMCAKFAKLFKSANETWRNKRFFARHTRPIKAWLQTYLNCCLYQNLNPCMWPPTIYPWGSWGFHCLTKGANGDKTGDAGNCFRCDLGDALIHHVTGDRKPITVEHRVIGIRASCICPSGKISSLGLLCGEQWRWPSLHTWHGQNIQNYDVQDCPSYCYFSMYSRYF